MSTVFNNVAGRILQILELKGIKPTPFELRIKISRGYLTRVAEKNSTLGTEIVEKVLREFPDVRAEWLLLGEAPKFRNEKDLSEVAEEKGNYKSRLTELQETLELFRKVQRLEEEKRLLEEEVARLKKSGNGR